MKRPSSPELGESGRGQWLLWVGVGAGLSLAIGSLSLSSTSSPGAVPKGAVAVVDGVEIPRRDYDAMLRTIQDGAGRTPTEADKRAAVDELIEEELMIEQGLHLDMVRGDPSTRHALLSAVFAAERAPGEGEEPSAEALQRLYLEIRNDLAPERGTANPPTLEEAKDAVLARYKQKSGDEAFARKTAALRAKAKIRVVEKLP